MNRIAKLILSLLNEISDLHGCKEIDSMDISERSGGLIVIKNDLRILHEKYSEESNKCVRNSKTETNWSGSDFRISLGFRLVGSYLYLRIIDVDVEEKYSMINCSWYDYKCWL